MTVRVVAMSTTILEIEEMCRAEMSLLKLNAVSIQGLMS